LISLIILLRGIPNEKGSRGHQSNSQYIYSALSFFHLFFRAGRWPSHSKLIGVMNEVGQTHQLETSTVSRSRKKRRKRDRPIDPNASTKLFNKKGGKGIICGATTNEIWLRFTYKIPEKILDIPVAGTKVSSSAT